MTIPPPTLEAAPEETPTPSGQWIMPPGLKHSLPFYAYKPWVKLGSPILLFEHLHRTFGPIARYRFMGTDIVFLNHPEYIREVLTPPPRPAAHAPRTAIIRPYFTLAGGTNPFIRRYSTICP